MYMVTSGRQPGIGTSLVQRGLSGCGDTCKCGGVCKGLGLFDSMDFTTWGLGEWAVVVIGGYAVLSMLFTTQRAARAVGRIPGQRRQRKAARLREKARQLTGRKGLL